MTLPILILASASPRRLQLLAQIGIVPSQVVPADIDETPHKAERPLAYVQRVATQKAAQVSAQFPASIVLAADTTVACGARILPKAETEAQAKRCLEMLSGRRHRVYTAVCLQQGSKQQLRVAMTQVAFKRLLPREIDAYIASGEWQGKAGGYGIQGRAEAFIPWISGSYSNVVGLPLAETSTMLQGYGIRIF
jgi:septum formation protein